MKAIQSIIVDDELNAIKTLRWEINNLEMPIEVVDSFTCAYKAIDYLSLHINEIDLVFLDIQMPTINGFEFLDKFKGRSFQVIFVTAYDEYALQAIKESAVDYILKPVDEEELKASVQKVISQQSKMHNVSEKEDSGKISIPVENELIFLNPKQIIYCKSDGNYTKIFMSSGDTFFISKTLKYIEDLLPAKRFFRIHQSYLINLMKIIAFNRSSNYITLDNKEKIPVSRSKRSDLLERF